MCCGFGVVRVAGGLSERMNVKGFELLRVGRFGFLLRFGFLGFFIDFIFKSGCFLEELVEVVIFWS